MPPSPPRDGTTEPTTGAPPVRLAATEDEGAGDELPPGTDLGRYVIRRRLGRGGMGVVYEAWDPELDRRIAIKLLRERAVPDPRALARARREALALARVSHPNVVAAYDAGIHEERMFLAMELVDGETLGAYLQRTRPRWHHVLALFVQAGRGLAAVHAQGLVHRDFKPSNVLVSASPSGMEAEGRVRVSDFGLARTRNDEHESSDDGMHPAQSSSGALGTSVTKTGAVLGTPRYMAPEQHRGAIADARSDQFAFCIALWEAIYGEHPFAAPGDDVAAAVVAGRLRAPTVRRPRWLLRLLERGLAAEPSQRHPTMTTLVDILERTPRRRAIAALLAAGVLAASAAAATAFTIADADGPACDRAADAWALALDEPRRTAIVDAFARARATDPDASARAVLDDLDAWGVRWTGTRVEACRATHERGERSAALLDRRMACLDRQLGLADALVVAVGGATAQGLDRARDAVAFLSDPVACTGDEIDELFPTSPDPALVDLRRRLDHATAQLELGEARGVLDELATIDVAVHDSVDADLRARASFALGLALIRTDDFPGGVAKMEQAATLAAEGYDRVLEARIAVMLIGTAANDRNLPRLEAQALMARTAVTRAGRPTQLAIELEWGYARGLVIQAEHERAAAACAELRRVADESADPDHPDVAHCECVVAEQAGRPSDAAEPCARWVEAAEARYGVDSPRLGDASYTLAQVQLQLGDAAASLVASDRAIAIAERAAGADGVDVVFPLVAKARALASLHRMPEARPVLERAVAIGERAMGSYAGMLAAAYLDLGSVCERLDDRPAARRYLQRAIEAAEAALGKDHPDLAEFLITRAYRLLEDPAVDKRDLVHDLERAIVLADASGRRDRIATAKRVIAMVLVGLGRATEAVPIAETALALARETLPDPGMVAQFQVDLGKVRLAAGDAPGARAEIVRARQVYVAAGDEDEAEYLDGLLRDASH